MAGSLIAVIPVLIVAMIAQRKVVEGLTIGAARPANASSGAPVSRLTFQRLEGAQSLA